MALKPVFNPFTNELQFINCPSDQSDSPAITNIFSCDSTAVIGDLVYQSLTNDKHVITSVDNNSPVPIIGFIKNKIDQTTANVTMIGLMSTTNGLIRGKKVFVGIDGTPTHIPPNINYQQVLGYANSDNELYFRPEFKRTKKT